MNKNTLPNFFILGAAKSGTTTLYDMLKIHPQIYLPYVKEPMFFSRDDYFQRGLTWYANTFFQKSDSYPARGEATPHYLYWAEKVAPRLKKIYGESDIRLICIFRDPVQRAYSGYLNMIREEKENLGFAEALDREDQRIKDNWETLYQTGAMTYGYFKGGCYATQIEEYLKHFDRKQFFFLLQDDLKCGQTSLIELHQFLNVEPEIRLDTLVSNPASMPRNRALHRWLHEPSIVKNIIKKISPQRWRYMLKAKITKANMQTVEVPKIAGEVAIELKYRFRGEIERLENIIGRDLSQWRN